MTKRNKAMQLALGLSRFAKHMETEQHKMWGMKTFCYYHPGTSFTFRTVQEIKDMSAKIAKEAHDRNR